MLALAAFILTLLSSRPSSAARAVVHVKELVSREASIHVGGIQTPEIREVV